MSAPTPALPPPSGREPDFANPDSLHHWVIVCVSICLSTGTVLCCLRSYVRLGIKRSWIFEDYLVLVAWAGLVTYCALLITLMHRHGGVHGWDLTKADVYQANYWTNASSILYSLVMLLVKAAILVYYRRIFLTRKGDFFDWALRIFMAILIIFYITTMLAKIWACSPRERIWNRDIPGKCLSIPSLFNASGLFNWITDILMLLIPVEALWKLQMNARTKAGIATVFTLGFCAPVFGIVGFVVRLRIGSSKDVTYYSTEISLWAAAEIAIGFICVCVPELAALAKRRRHGRPSQSIVNGATSYHRAGHYRLRRLGSLDEGAPWEGSQLKYKGHPEVSSDVPLPPAGVITEIHGGAHTPSDQFRPGNLYSQSPNASNGTEGIYTSVKMERSVADVVD